MSDDHDGGPTTDSARANIVEYPTLSEHTIDILQRCLEDHEARLSHVGRTILLLRVLRVDDLVQWTNNTLRIGTENTLNLARDLGLSANNTKASCMSRSCYLKSDPTDMTQPVVDFHVTALHPMHSPYPSTVFWLLLHRLHPQPGIAASLISLQLHRNQRYLVLSKVAQKRMFLAR